MFLFSKTAKYIKNIRSIKIKKMFVKFKKKIIYSYPIRVELESSDCPIVSCGSRVSFCPVCGGKVRAVLLFRVCLGARMVEELEML